MSASQLLGFKEMSAFDKGTRLGCCAAPVPYFASAPRGTINLLPNVPQEVRSQQQALPDGPLQPTAGWECRRGTVGTGCLKTQ